MAIEEKVDGANDAISFSSDGQMLLQSRGHYLTGGEREKHFNLFKQWAYTHAGTFWAVLGDRYILYNETPTDIGGRSYSIKLPQDGCLGGSKSTT